MDKIEEKMLVKDVKDISKKKVCYIVLREGDYLQLFCAFSVCILDKFSVKQKRKIIFRNSISNFMEKTHFPLAGFHSSSSRGFQNLPVSS